MDGICGIFRRYPNWNHYIFGLGFFQARSPQLEPLDGRKGLTSGWIFLIVLYLFKKIFSKGWEEGENG